MISVGQRVIILHKVDIMITEKVGSVDKKDHIFYNILTHLHAGLHLRQNWNYYEETDFDNKSHSDCGFC